MKKTLIIFFLFLISNLAFSQKLYGDWELKTLTYKGGKPEKEDKMFLGDGLEIHLGHKSHLSITVFHDNEHKVKHKDSWYESDNFIILNDKIWGNATYNILDITKNTLTLERMLPNRIELLLYLERKNLKNHHFHYKTFIES